MGPCPHLYCKIRNSLQLRRVPFHDRRMDLERQSGSPAVFHPAHSLRPAARIRPKPIMLLCIERIQRYSHAHGPSRLQVPSHFRCKQYTVRTKNRPHPQRSCTSRELQDIWPQQRLTAAENHDLETRPGNLAQHLPGFCRRQLIRCLTASITITMRTMHIAKIRRIPGYNHKSPPPLLLISSSVR